MSHDEGEHEQFESRLMASRDAIDLRQSSLEEGKAVGFAKGKAIGFAEGVREGFAKGYACGYSRGVKEGFSEGKQIGLAEGRLLALFQLIELEIDLKFGSASSSLLPRIRTILDLDRLRDLYKTARLATILQEIEERLG